jgi:hypothetical protein
VLTTLEIGGALLLSLLSLFAPFIALILVVAVCVLTLRFARKLMRKSRTASDAR